MGGNADGRQIDVLLDNLHDCSGEFRKRQGLVSDECGGATEGPEVGRACWDARDRSATDEELARQLQRQRNRGEHGRGRASITAFELGDRSGADFNLRS